MGLPHLDGKTTQRHRLVKQWNDPEGPPVFLISLKAGGSGLNLTGADHVIHLDPWWNPAVEQQATDRAHRIGQDRPVVAYKLVARNTIEEKVLALQEQKRDLFDQTIEQDRFSVQQLSRTDIEAFFRRRTADCRRGRETISISTNGLLGTNELEETLLESRQRLTNAIVRDWMGWTSDEASHGSSIKSTSAY